MQYITHWPELAELDLPKTLAHDLHRRLLESFDSEGEAKEFWNETTTTLTILDPTDSITALKESDIWNELEFPLMYTEYTVQLKMGYQLLVAIVNDSGSGIFLVIPPELTHIMSIGVENP